MVFYHKVLKHIHLRNRFDLGVLNLFVNFTNIIRSKGDIFTKIQTLWGFLHLTKRKKRD